MTNPSFVLKTEYFGKKVWGKYSEMRINFFLGTLDGAFYCLSTFAEHKETLSGVACWGSIHTKSQNFSTRYVN